MCRMIGIISVDKISPYKYLYDSECSLYRQAEKGRQDDGWGVAYYDNGELIVFKSPNTVYKEKELFLRVIRNIRTHLCIAHVRNASNPRNLPKETLISLENTQPFFYGDFVFIHNGTVRVVEIEEKLGKYKRLVKGLNDSELYFYLLLKCMDETGDLIEAVKKTEKVMWETFKEVKRNIKNPFSSLNMIFSDGKRLYALTRYIEHHNSKSICYGDAEIFRIAYLYDGKKMVVASERTDNKNWTLMNNGEMLIAEIDNGRITYTIERIF